ncbi:haloacid dehalogenase superfamily, subfamily IA, variant 1 with third motif having Dx(3-4)D or Dx(3-4)E [Clostridium acidisoli DSM 12555]|uniref:Haloacid dehalogenase superfamily, subfamily IA, variant 1 with third motif having Dx(3-4)D or Dx(3-4)E n=1 Tax=Clostridium acidisoli DSM 12555 TaxID=1121291 RepID=A0A1W1X3I0_9CLOT|nr:HAD-IA family hydrolase [Clostridium acidisoli]SMC18393.1 haloacid dehalogenase superfamily, subfamily IA, variant 1 with third motif having Dx(3-4)D or Dx(3-4)E [Clostridium acidisoli DSM 12555]
MIRDIIWDFDGTLFNTYPGTVNSFRKTLKDNGIDESNENILNYMKISESYALTYFKELYGLDDNFIEKYTSYKKDMKPEMIQPFPFAADVCRRVIDLGGRNYIITHRGESTLKILQHYGMMCYFTEIITKQYGFKRKPDPEAFIYLIEKYQINKRTALVIGDRECEVLGGKAAGIRTCLYDTNNVSLTEVPDYNIDSLKNLVDMLN